MPRHLTPCHGANPSQADEMIRNHSSFLIGATVFNKDTPERIHLALASAFLVRWVLASPIRHLLFAGLLIGFMILAPLAVCSAATPQAMPLENTATSSAIEVKDEVGRAVRIPQRIRRIVSLAPSVTETLFALGLGDQLVGDTDFCDYPPAAKQKRHIGGPVNPNIETVAALHPDLVVASREINRAESVYSLERLGIPVYTTDPQSIEQVLASTERLAELLGASDAGRTLTADLRRRLGELDQRLAGVPPKNVLMIVWLDPLISVGRNTFMDDALRHAGARSVIESPQSWPKIDLEQVVRLQPEYLIISNDNHQQVQRELSELQERPSWRQLDAVRNRRFIVLSEAISHPSPRLLDGIEQLARSLFQSKFTAASFLRYLQMNCSTLAFAPASGSILQSMQMGACR